MNHRNQLKSGVVLSYVNLLIGNIIPFIYTPIMLRLLGQAEYGLFGIANSVMGYIALFHTGFGSAIIRYLSRYRAMGDTQQERRVLGLFIKLYSAIAVLVLAAGFILSGHLEGYGGRSLTADELNTLKVLVRLMTINMAVFLPLSVFASVAIAHERYLVNRLVNILTTIISPCLNLVLLFFGWRSVGLVISATVINLLSSGIYIFYSFRRLHIRPSFRKCQPGLLRDIALFSLFALLGSLVDVLYWSTDRLIIGWAMGTVFVAVYNIGATFNGYLTSLATAISGILMPRVATIVQENKDPAALSDLFIKVGRLQFLVVSFIVSAFVVFGRQFISLWAGPDYAQAYTVALLTMIPVMVPLIQSTGLNILMVLNKHRFRSIVYLIIALLNIALTFLLVERHGIIGAAAATCAAYVLGNCIIMNWYYHRVIGLDIPRFWKNIATQLPVMVLFIGAGFPVMRFVPIAGWGSFFGCAVIYTVLFFLAAWLLAMNAYERQLVKGPLQKIMHRLTKKRKV